MQESEEIEDIRRTWPTEPTRQHLREPTKVAEGTMGLRGSASGSLVCVRAISLLFCETPNSVSGCNSASFGLYLRLFSCYWVALSSRDT